MRTVVAGLRVLRRTPAAILPLTIEGIVAAALIALHVLPPDGVSAPAAAVFPLDVYFDVKQSLTHATGWLPFIAALGASLVVRSVVLGSTLWLSEQRRGSFFTALRATALLVGVAALALVPSALFFFVGVAVRYAPFIWIGALLGFVAAVVLVRHALALDVGAGRPRGRGVPEAGSWLTYAYVIVLVAAAMSLLGRTHRLLPALLLVFLGPLHALVLLGWREHLRSETYPGGGLVSMAVTVVIVLGLAGVAVFDRYIRTTPPVARAPARGSLLVLGGVDSTSKTGALADFDARSIGFARRRLVLLSYRRPGRPYRRQDTRRDLRDVASIVAAQVERAAEPRFLLGHSQASLIVDRLLDGGLTAPDRAAVFAGAPPWPPEVTTPLPGQPRRGRPGADLARALSAAFDLVGLGGFDIDAPASPSNLEPVVVPDAHQIARLSVWALGDSVWLDGDWRRPGEINVIAISDHVGTTRNGRSLRLVRDFFAGQRVESDETSWRSILVNVLRFGFEPWRPG